MSPATARTTRAPALDDILAGRLGVRAVRALATDPLGHELCDLLRQRVPDAGGAPDLMLLRTKYKPPGRLTAYYETTVGGGVRHLAVRWSAEAGADPAVDLWVSPDDTAMPQLSRLTRPEHLAALLVAQGAARDLAPATDPSARLRIRTIRYRPGQRHVLHVAPGHGPGVFVKIDRDDSGAHAVPIAKALRPLLARRCPRVRVVAPVGYVPADRAALWREAPGQPLSALLGEPRLDAVDLVSTLGEALRVLHDVVRGTSAQGLPLPPVRRHDAHAEASSTLRAATHIMALLPEVGTAYRALVSAVVDALDGLPAETGMFCHGDVKCENVLVDHDRLRVLDLDRCCSADPALDLGKLLADLRWWSPSQAQVDVLQAAVRDAYGDDDPTRWARAELLAVLFTLKFAARRIPVHEFGWQQRIERQMQLARAEFIGAELNATGLGAAENALRRSL